MANTIVSLVLSLTKIKLGQVIIRGQKNKDWLLAKIIPSKAAPKDRESEEKN